MYIYMYVYVFQGSPLEKHTKVLIPISGIISMQ